MLLKGRGYVRVVEVFLGGDKDWWWRAIAYNNRKVAGSLEGYKNRQDAIKSARRIVRGSRGRIRVIDA